MPPDGPDEHELAERAARRQARSLYFRGWTIKQIAGELARISHGGELEAPRRVGQVCPGGRDRGPARSQDRHPARQGAVHRGRHEAGRFPDAQQVERTARVRKYNATGKEGDLNPKIGKRNDEAAKAKRAEKRKNFLTLDQWQALLDDFHEKNFDHQAGWWAMRGERTRKIL